MMKAPNSCVASLPHATVASHICTRISTPMRFRSAWIASAARLFRVSLMPYRMKEARSPPLTRTPSGPGAQPASSSSLRAAAGSKAGNSALLLGSKSSTAGFR